MFRLMLMGASLLVALAGCCLGEYDVCDTIPPGAIICRDSLVEYYVHAEFTDAESSEPLADAEVTIYLYRSGEELSAWGHASVADQDGKWGHSYIMGLTGTCGPAGHLVCMEASPLGDPPDQIELQVEMPDGRQGNVTLPLNESHFVEFRDSFCVRFQGTIDLGQVAVTLSPSP